jgi:hypothetical protein
MSRSLRGFVPWIAFGIVSGFADWRAGAVTALVLAVLVLADGVRTGHGLDESVIECSATLFFVVIAVVAFLAPHAAIQHYTGPLSMGWLAVTAWGSLAVRRPFTLGIARRSVPEQFWDNPLFYRANAIITSVWAASFTITALVQWLIDATMANPDTVSVIVQVAGFVVPAAFTIRYQKAREQAARAQFGAAR